MLNGITWNEFFIWVGTLAALYVLGVLVTIGKAKGKAAPAPAGSNTGKKKKVWHVDEQPIDETYVLPPVTHLPYMGTPADKDEHTLDEKVPAELDLVEATIELVIKTYDPVQGTEVLIDKLRSALEGQPVANDPAYRELVSDLIIQKAWAIHNMALSQEDLSHL